MRILHTEASRGWGGQEIRILTEARVFIAHGHDVRLVCDPDSQILQAAPRYGVPAIAIDLKRKSLASWRALRAVIADFRPDVINPHSSIDGWMVALARLGMRPRPRVVRTRHISAAIPRNPASRWLWRQGCDFVMTTGEMIVDQLTTDGFLPRERVSSVPTGIDTEVFAAGDKAAARAALGLPADAWLLGSVATLRSWKGHLHLVDAFAGLDAPKARLVIVGDGPEGHEVVARVAQHGLEDRVIMAGRRDDVPKWLSAFDAFALASYANEGVPQAILQAMAAELPIVSCPIGGIPECTRGVESVTLVPPKDSEALRVAIQAMHDTPPSAEARAGGRRRVLDVYSLERMYRTVLGCFEGR